MVLDKLFFRVALPREKNPVLIEQHAGAATAENRTTALRCSSLVTISTELSRQLQKVLLIFVFVTGREERFWAGGLSVCLSFH